MIFSDNYEIQTILFLVTIIFVNYAYSSILEILLDLNSYFQKILIAVNKNYT